MKKSQVGRVRGLGRRWTGRLPGWDDLPAERQRELVVTLSGMVVKQLHARPETERWERHERG